MFVLTVPAAFCVDETLISLVSLNTPTIAPKYVVLVTLVSLNLGGPFISKQKGLHGVHGDSADWEGCYTDEVMAMHIKPDTSFAGLYAELGSVGTPFISRYQLELYHW